MSISDYFIHKDNQLLVCNKPAAIPTQKDLTGDKAMVDLAEIYGKKKLWVTNRIDRPASGLVIFAKTAKAAAHINQLFADQKITKYYLAAVPKGIADSGQLEHQLVKSKSNKSIVIDKTSKQSKTAIATFEKIVELNTWDILKISTKTGRHHQIRAQLAHHGFPIKGDVKYGARRGNKDRSIHLHCHQIEITHPVTEEPISLECMPNTEDPIWKAMIESLSSN